MFVNQIVLGTNPFYDAYIQSDFLGKLIFIALIILSICSWVVLLHKLWQTHLARKSAARFYEAFQLQKGNPLSLDCENINRQKALNPFLDLYQVMKKQTMEMLNKNRHFGMTHADGSQKGNAYLSSEDIDYVASHLNTSIANRTKDLEKNLYILSTTVSLAPFLGLLGTVWGILTTFSEMQAHTGGGSHQMVLGGLSLALATTVLGLMDAIPALIGYNYLKNNIRDFGTEMEGFSNDILTSVELQYRKVTA
jgi:biopolymer transport protein TolQ